MTVYEFLRARLDESEGMAATGNGDPTHTLAMIGAMRQIVDHAELWQRTRRATPEGWTERTATSYRMAMDWTLNQLSSIYADHPDHTEA